MARMQRTQICLEPELAASLDRLARDRGTSRAEVIRTAARRLVAEHVSTDTDSILEIIGIGQDAASDVSENHDAYLTSAETGRWTHD
jgi:metal-responsive CopG/Arc/MetJ family transcriptional regulator